MFTKWIPRRTLINKAFKKFSKIKVKNKKHAEVVIRGNKSLKSAVQKLFTKDTVKKVFSKKALASIGIASAVGYGAHYINNYIQSNSGCFLISGNAKGDSICKVRELSCCQPEPVANLNYCKESKLAAGNPCLGFDEDREQSCCRHCNCQEFECLPHQRMECRRPTVADSLSHLSQEVFSHFNGILKTLLPWLYTAASILLGLIVLWIGYVIFNKVRR